MITHPSLDVYAQALRDGPSASLPQAAQPVDARLQRWRNRLAAPCHASISSTRESSELRPDSSCTRPLPPTQQQQQQSPLMCSGMHTESASQTACSSSRRSAEEGSASHMGSESYVTLPYRTAPVHTSTKERNASFPRDAHACSMYRGVALHKSSSVNNFARYGDENDDCGSSSRSAVHHRTGRGRGDYNPLWDRHYSGLAVCTARDAPRDTFYGGGNHPNAAALRAYRRGVAYVAGVDPAHARAQGRNGSAISNMSSHHHHHHDGGDVNAVSTRRDGDPLDEMLKRRYGDDVGVAPSCIVPSAYRLSCAHRCQQHQQQHQHQADCVGAYSTSNRGRRSTSPSVSSSLLQQTGGGSGGSMTELVDDGDGDADGGDQEAEAQRLFVFIPLLSPLLQEVNECLHARQLGSLLDVWRAPPAALRALLASVGFSTRECGIIAWELERMVRVSAASCAV